MFSNLNLKLIWKIFDLFYCVKIWIYYFRFIRNYCPLFINNTCETPFCFNIRLVKARKYPSAIVRFKLRIQVLFPIFTICETVQPTPFFLVQINEIERDFIFSNLKIRHVYLLVQKFTFTWDLLSIDNQIWYFEASKI